MKTGWSIEKNCSGSGTDNIIRLGNRSLTNWYVLIIVLCVLILCINMRIEKVRVLGNSAYTGEEAENAVFGSSFDRNIIVAAVKDRLGKKKELPFVSDYQIRITGKDSCDLIFYEKIPVGCFRYMSNYIYFDREGYIIYSSESRYRGVPEIRGIEYGNIVSGSQIKLKHRTMLDEIMNITGQLSVFGLECDDITFDDAGNAEIFLAAESLKVRLGSDADMPAKLSALNDMLPDIRKRRLKGVLDMSSFRDGSSENTVSLRMTDEI